MRQPSRQLHPDQVVRRRVDPAKVNSTPPRKAYELLLAQVEQATRAARRSGILRDALDRNLLHLSAALFFVGSVGWCWLVYSQFRASMAPPAAYFISQPGSVPNKTDWVGTSVVVKTGGADTAGDRTASIDPNSVSMSDVTPASIVAREWSQFGSVALNDDPSSAPKPMSKEPRLKPAVRLASLETAPPQLAVNRPTEPVVPSRVPRFGAITSLVDFENAPFPYHGRMPGSNRPFLDAGQQDRPAHVNFRGRVFWESQTFGDDRVLLHIPPGFDPSRPAVMVVFFHGHGATLSRDVRDRQQVPAQITAAGMNAVLVAPQFAVDAADSSAGKFWEPNGFKRFLDEAAIKLAKLYGDQRSATAFANMPIVIVAYSGGFGPTLSVLDRGGVSKARIRGVVLLDALYAGIDRFADWIAANRSAFFVSSYTPHTAHHNADLQRLLRERSVPYNSELRRAHLQGTVTFLPTGDISHRDFVNRAWTDGPIKDILTRMDDVQSKIGSAGARPGALAAAGN
jgi:hypothetical protein